MGHERADAGGGDAGEPGEGDRSEIHADPAGAALLQGEHADEDGGRHARDEHRQEAGGQRPLEAFVGFPDAFQGRQHRDGRSDDAVAEEQGGAEDAQQDEHAAVLTLGLLVGDLLGLLVVGLLLGRGEGDQGHDAAFAVLVGLHDEEDVFDRHDADQGPDDHRDGRDDDLLDGAAVVEPVAQAFAEGVEGARPDVTEDDPEGRDGGRHGQRFGGGGALGRLRVGRAHGELFTVTAPRG